MVMVDFVRCMFGVVGLLIYIREINYNYGVL